MSSVPKEAGKSSFDLIDQQRLFEVLPASGVDFVLDFGCGVGNYLFALADYYSDARKLVGVDLWEEGINILNRRARELGLPRVKGVKSSGLDLGFIAEAQVDLVLMATVLHDLAERSEEEAALKEISRILHHGGTLAVVEFKKVEAKRGPPISIRISESELPAMVKPFGFAENNTADIGPHCYISTFTRDGNQRMERKKAY